MGRHSELLGNFANCSKSFLKVCLRVGLSNCRFKNTNPGNPRFSSVFELSNKSWLLAARDMSLERAVHELLIGHEVVRWELIHIREGEPSK